MKNIFFILLVLSISSCGIFRKKSKDKLLEKIETQTETNRDSLGIKTDRSVTVITEKSDTSILTPEKKSTSEVSVSLDSLVNGLTAISNDLVDVKLAYDSVTKKLNTVVTIKPQRIPFKIDRKIVIQKDLFQESNVKDAAIINENKTTKRVSTKKEPAKMGIWLLAVGAGVLILIGIGWYYLRKRKIL